MKGLAPKGLSASEKGPVIKSPSAPEAERISGLALPDAALTTSQPGALGQRPSAPGQQPSAPGQRPSAPGQRPSAPGQRPSAPGEIPAGKKERGQVLVVVADDWMAALLRGHLNHAGFVVHVAGEAREGYRLARDVGPDCVVCDEQLPDIDGFWLIDRVRRDPGPVSTVPVLLLTETIDEVRGADVGADLLLKKPIDNEELVAQVAALLELTRRIKGGRQEVRRDSIPASMGGSAALRGDIAQMSVATVLTVLEMERRTGVLQVEGALALAESKSYRLELRDGGVVGAQLAGKDLPALDLLRQLVKLERGKFWFGATDTVMSDKAAQSLGMLMLEAARLEDEGDR